MNKLKHILFILLSCSLFSLNSCKEEGDVKITLDTVEDGMHLTVNAPELVLSQEKMEETALKFTWGPAQARKNNGHITYAFKLGLPGFTTATDTIHIPEGVNEYSISHYDLNMLIYSKLGQAYGSTSQLEAEIIASSEGGNFYVKPEISTVKFLVTTFKVAPVNLYLVGTANPNGAEITKGIKLNEIIEGRNIGNNYQWEGVLQAGTFKFVNSISEDKGSWSKGASETELVANGNSEFTVNKPGLYSIILNKATGEIIHGYKGFSHVWGVGSGIGIAWSMPSSAEFTWDAHTPNIFKLECNTQANQDFKLPYNDQGAGWGCPFLRPVNGNANIWQDNRVQATPAGFNPDNKWLISADQAGHCLLTIDALNETITLEKLQ
ncbi:MAG: SusE domain-containing protein [Candidatus Saccharibacteria bacterium]